MFVRLEFVNYVMDGLAMTGYAESFDVGFEHVESRRGHVSTVLLGQNAQFGLGYVIGQNIFLCGGI